MKGAKHKMKKIFIKLASVILLGATLFTSVGCVSDQNKTEDEEPIATQSYVVEGKEFFFIDDEVKKEWEEPLAKLLANVRVPYGGKEGIDGYKASVDSKMPVIPQNYRCGLLDVTEDGIPELLVLPFGYNGSSGMESYYAYNIYSGQKIGEISGSPNASWCFYYDKQNDRIELYGQYWLRDGAFGEDFFLKGLNYFDMEMECYMDEWLHARYDLSRYVGADADSNDDLSEFTDKIKYSKPPTNPLYDDSKIGECMEITYYINDKVVTFDEYYAECDEFVTSKIKIPQTEFIMIDWDDVSDDDDDYVTKGKKMAKALINTEQKFIVP